MIKEASREELANLVKSILSKELDYDFEDYPGFNNDTHLYENGVGLDSLDAVLLLSKVEDQLNITIDATKLKRLKTINDIVDCLLEAYHRSYH